MSNEATMLLAGRYKLEVVKAPHLPAYMTVDQDCVLLAAAVAFAPSSPVPGVVVVTATPVDVE